MIEICRALYDQILAHLAATWPNEGCGLLGGTGAVVNTDMVAAQVSSVWPVSNVAANPASWYKMHSGEQVRAMLALEAEGQTLVGIFHSHPDGRASPSPTDMAEAYYPEAAYLISARTAAGWHTRAFDLSGLQAHEILFSVVASCPE